MKKFLIIADDFTGAYDTGAQFKKKGIETHVVLDVRNMISNQSYIIDTETRGLEKNDAYNRIKDIIIKINSTDFNFYFKRVDSTLRGNIGAEIKALDEKLNFELIVFVPAYPKIKRTIVGGTLLLNNVPIKKTGMAYDPRNVVCEDNVKKLLESELEEAVQHIELSDIRNKPINIKPIKHRLVSFDATTDKDLVSIVKYIIDHDKKTLWVGSRGLVDALLHVLYPANPVLCVIGSVSEITRKQVNYAMSKGANLVHINIIALIKGLDKSIYVDEAVKKINNGKDTIIYTSINKNDISDKINEAQKLGIEKGDLFSIINNTLGEISCEILNKVKVSGVFLTGGDTVVSFVNHNSVNEPQIMGELLPSVQLLFLDRGNNKNIKVAIKGGHVGKITTLNYCISKLKGIY